MTKKELEAKVINAQSAVAKREAVLAKHREQLAKLISKGADQYDIRYKEGDIKTATSKLEDARRILKYWQDKLGAHISRDAFIEASAPQVIKDFLERWKASAILYYRQRRIDFIEYRKELRQKEREARLDHVDSEVVIFIFSQPLRMMRRTPMRARSKGCRAGSAALTNAGLPHAFPLCDAAGIASPRSKLSKPSFSIIRKTALS